MQVTHKVNGNSSPKSPKPVLPSDCSESKEGKEERSNNNDLETRPAQCV